MNTNFTFKNGTANFYLFTFLFTCLLLNFNSFGQDLGQAIRPSLTETWEVDHWVNAYREIDEYDGNHYVISSVIEQWNTETSVWEKVTKTTYVNNSNGTIQQATTSYWNSVEEEYTLAIRNTYTYHNGEQIATFTTETYFDPAWQTTLEITNSYDGSDHLINTVEKRWDFLTSTLKNATQTNFFNNANGTINYYIDQNWNDTASGWDDDERHTFTYVNTDKVKTELTERWISGAWVNDSMETITYDNDGFIINSLEEKWDTPTSAWLEDTQLNFDNNEDGSYHIVVSQNFDYVLNDWVNDTRYTFESVLAIHRLSDQREVTLFPNPARDLVTIKTGLVIPNLEYTVIDQLGRTVLNGTMDNEETNVDINQLRIGVYFIRIGNQNARSLKMIKN